MIREEDLNKCSCGGAPQFHCERVAEDAEECWVECPKCGRKTDEREDAYCDFESSAWDWNSLNEQDRLKMSWDKAFGDWQKQREKTREVFAPIDRIRGNRVPCFCCGEPFETIPNSGDRGMCDPCRSQH